MDLNFRRNLPKSGMIYRSRYRLLHRTRRDVLVANALKGAGYQRTKPDIRRAFIPMFQIATPIFIDARAEGKSLWDMLPEVKRELDWARALSDAVFLELFTCLYDPLVVELVRCRKAVGDCPQEDNIERPDYISWILVDAEIYNFLAGGLDEDEDEDEDKVEQEDEEMGKGDEREDLVPPMAKMTMEAPEEQFEAMDLDP